MKLTVKKVRGYVAAIELTAMKDEEEAHKLEDALHKVVLESVASGDIIDPCACAAEALKSGNIEFSRWCA